MVETLSGECVECLERHWGLVPCHGPIELVEFHPAHCLVGACTVWRGSLETLAILILVHVISLPILFKVCISSLSGTFLAGSGPLWRSILCRFGPLWRHLFGTICIYLPTVSVYMAGPVLSGRRLHVNRPCGCLSDCVWLW